MHKPITDEAILSWHNFLDRFNAEIYPKIFRPYGIDRDVAHIIWSQNSIVAELQRLHGSSIDDEDEGWRK